MYALFQNARRRDGKIEGRISSTTSWAPRRFYSSYLLTRRRTGHGYCLCCGHLEKEGHCMLKRQFARQFALMLIAILLTAVAVPARAQAPPPRRKQIAGARLDGACAVTLGSCKGHGLSPSWIRQDNVHVMPRYPLNTRNGTVSELVHRRAAAQYRPVASSTVAPPAAELGFNKSKRAKLEILLGTLDLTSWADYISTSCICSRAHPRRTPGGILRALRSRVTSRSIISLDQILRPEPPV